MLGGKAGDGRAEGWMDRAHLHWISPSWLRLLGTEVPEKGRQLPPSSQPLCIQPRRDLCARRRGICREQ